MTNYIKNNKSAFTLIELLVVIAIIGILSGLIVVTMNGATASANDAKRKASIDAIKKALIVYGTLNGMSYPVQTTQCYIAPTVITNRCGNLDVLSDLIPVFPVDPVSGYYTYVSNGSSFTVSGILSNSNVYSYSSFTDSTPSSCLAILNTGRSTGSGIYSISPAGTDVQVYCDMTTLGGGWTLVLQNNNTVATPAPNWNDAINNITILGTLGSNQAAFDILVGLDYWGKIGSQLMAQVGTSPTVISHRATYNFYLDSSAFYKITLSNQDILVGSNAPGLYTAHNNKPFTTYDSDHDTSGSNCATSYNNHPWWYTSCWNGNFLAGGSYQDAAYWTGSGTDYYAHGSIWVR